jgi:hypothetical protein
MLTETTTKTVRLTPGLPAGPRPRAAISTDAPDSEGDRVMQPGLSFRPRMRVAPFHDYRVPPVAIVTAIHRFPHHTEAEFEWIEGDPATERIRTAYNAGALDASIGFTVQKKTPNEFGGFDILRARVHEFSLTGIPANEGAVALTKSHGQDAPVLIVEDDDDALVRVDPADVAVAVQQHVGELVQREVRRASVGLLGMGREQPLVFVLADDGAPDPGDEPRFLVDPADVMAAMDAALQTVITREVRAAVNYHLGKVD